MYPFTEYIAGQITAAFEQLLNNKHLYQHVDLDLSGINDGLPDCLLTHRKHCSMS